MMITDGKKPWEIHPDLKADRLIVIAQLLADVRLGALADHSPKKGDGSWSLGCRIYERSINGIQKLVERGVHPWLGLVHRNQLEFCFSIGLVPMRFYHETDHRRPVQTSLPELEALQTAFPFAGEPELDKVLRIAYETDEDGLPDGFYLVQVTKGSSKKPYRVWPIPQSAPFEISTAARVINISDFQAEETEFSAPPISPEPHTTTDEEESEANAGEAGPKPGGDA